MPLANFLARGIISFPFAWWLHLIVQEDNTYFQKINNASS